MLYCNFIITCRESKQVFGCVIPIYFLNKFDRKKYVLVQNYNQNISTLFDKKLFIFWNGVHTFSYI
jgi:hypothetical protein